MLIRGCWIDSDWTEHVDGLQDNHKRIRDWRMDCVPPPLGKLWHLLDAPERGLVDSHR